MVVSTGISSAEPATPSGPGWNKRTSIPSTPSSVPSSYIPSLLLSAHTTEPILILGTKPKSTVILPLASLASSWIPPVPLSAASTGSVPTCKLTGFESTAVPEPAVWIPLSSSSRFSSGTSVLVISVLLKG